MRVDLGSANGAQMAANNLHVIRRRGKLPIVQRLRRA